MSKWKVACLLLWAGVGNAQVCENKLFENVRTSLAMDVLSVSQPMWTGLLPQDWTPHRVADAVKVFPEPSGWEQVTPAMLKHHILASLAAHWPVNANLGGENFADLFLRRRYRDYLKCYPPSGVLAYYVHLAAGVVYVTQRSLLRTWDKETHILGNLTDVEDVLRQTWKDTGRYSIQVLPGRTLMTWQRTSPRDIYQRSYQVPARFRYNSLDARVEKFEISFDGTATITRYGTEPERVHCVGPWLSVLRPTGP